MSRPTPFARINRKPIRFIAAPPAIKASARESHERASMTTLAKRQATLARARRLHDRCKRNLAECRQKLMTIYNNTRLWSRMVRQAYYSTRRRLRFLRQRRARQLNMIRILQAEIADLKEEARIARNFVDLSAEPDD